MTWDSLDTLARLRDLKLVQRARRCVRDAAWQRQLVFVAWFAEWLTSALRWGGSCICHVNEYEAGEAVKCMEKGRLLPLARAYSERCFQSGLKTAKAWGVADFDDCSQDFLASAVGAVRLVVGVGRKKLAYLDRVPLLLARIQEPGVAVRCTQEFDATDPARRDFVSEHFLAPGSTLRSQIDRYILDGSLGRDLEREIQALRDIPLHDVICEAPHAAANRVGMVSRRSRWPWLASSVRLDQNLGDARSLPARTGLDLQQTWNKWKSVLQASQKRLGRNRKCRTKDFLQSVYRVASVVGFGDAEPFDEDGAAGDDDVAGDDPPPDDGAAVPAVDKVELERTKMFQAFVESAAQQHAYVSAPAPADSDLKLRCFQILHKRRHHVLPEDKASAHRVPDNDWCVQFLEIWRGHERNLDAVSLEVFVLQEPSYASVSDLFGDDADKRSHLNVWSVGDSDLDGCLHLCRPKVMCPELSLKDPSVPVLCLLDAVLANGWWPRMSLVTHTKDSAPRVFDARHLAQRRSYLQAVLSSVALFEKGVVQFRSARTAAYYQWLLRSPGDVKESITCIEARKLVAEPPCMPSTPSLDVRVVVASVGARPLVLVDLDVDGGDDAKPVAAEPVAAEAAPALASSSSSSSSSSGSSDSDSSSASPGGASVEGDVPAPAGVVLPDEIEGIRWAVERRGTPGEGYRVKCALHPDCRAFRCSHIDVAVFGVMAAFIYIYIFLGAWLRQGVLLDADAHRAWRPKRTDVREYAATSEF